MQNFWEKSFQEKQMMWGDTPADSALFAKDFFEKHNLKNILIPGFGYGRNAKPFLESGMSVTGIEVSQTAIDLARSQGLSDITVYHGSVNNMPFNDQKYDGIFCYALIHLLDSSERKKLIANCYNQLKTGGCMIFTVISKKAPTYGSGKKLGKDRYELFEGVEMFFYDDISIQKEFGSYGLIDYFEINEPMRQAQTTVPFITIVCEKK